MNQGTVRHHKGEGHRKRLKQRFLESGLEGFHDYEVIELLLSLNTPRKDCKQSAKLLLERFKTLQAVMEARTEELIQVNGVGTANCLGIKLIKEVADRYLKSRIISKDVVNNPKDLAQYLRHAIGHKNKEVFAAVYLDAQNRVLTSEILFTGTLTQSSVYVREVILAALAHHAASIIFAHNHPSGSFTPSASDIQITKELFIALNFIGIAVLDHMIISRDGEFSFAENGLMNQFKNRWETIKNDG